MLQVNIQPRGEISAEFPIFFPMGQVVMTQGVDALVKAGKLNPLPLLKRHASGDWGDMCAEDRRTNEYALAQGDRLLSAYELAEDLKVWIITECDRSVTTLLLPSEY